MADQVKQRSEFERMIIDGVTESDVQSYNARMAELGRRARDRINNQVLEAIAGSGEPAKELIDESQYPEIEVLTIGTLGPEYDDKHCIRGPNGSTVWVPKSMSRRERWAVNQGLHPNYPTGEQCPD